MASVTIRNLDDGLKAKLRLRAAQHNRSMEDEVRDILRITLETAPARPQNLYQAIRARVDGIGGVDLELPPRDAVREPPDLS